MYEIENNRGNAKNHAFVITTVKEQVTILCVKKVEIYIKKMTTLESLPKKKERKKEK